MTNTIIPQASSNASLESYVKHVAGVVVGKLYTSSELAEAAAEAEADEIADAFFSSLESTGYVKELAPTVRPGAKHRRPF